MKAVDLDSLVPEDKTVTLAGVTYMVPGDMPMETYLRVNAAANGQESGASEIELMQMMKRSVMDLLLWRVDMSNEEGQNVAVALEKTLMHLGVRTVTSVLGAIYADDDDEAEPVEDPTPSTPPETGGTTNTTSEPQNPNAS